MAINFKSRSLHIPGIVFLFLSFVLLFIASISLPYLTDLDFVRVHFKDNLPTVGNDTDVITDVRVSFLLHIPLHATSFDQPPHIVLVMQWAICSLALGEQIIWIISNPH